jgi:hypothetical protein
MLFVTAVAVNLLLHFCRRLIFRKCRLQSVR